MDLTAFTTALVGMKDNIISVIQIAGPIVAVIVGAFLVWRMGKKEFLRLTRK